MKMYKLRVKQSIINMESNYFPKPINSIQGVNHCHYFDKSLEIMVYDAETADIMMTMEEIESLPYGFVKMFDIIEVEEPKEYYWKIKSNRIPPYVELHSEGYGYLNYDLDCNVVELNNNNESTCYDTKFTEERAMELLGEFFNDFEKVEIEDESN